MSFQKTARMNCCVCDKTTLIEIAKTPFRQLTVDMQNVASEEVGWRAPMLCGDPSCEAVFNGLLPYPSQTGVIGYAKSLELVVDENFRSREMDATFRALFPYREFFENYGWQNVVFPFVRFWRPGGNEAFVWFKDPLLDFRRFEGWAFFLVQQQLRQARCVYDIKFGGSYDELVALSETPPPIFICDSVKPGIARIDEIFGTLQDLIPLPFVSPGKPRAAVGNGEDSP